MRASAGPPPPASKKTRIVIVGGGPGGLALACGLAGQENLEIRVLEGRARATLGARAIRSHSIGLGRRAREALIAIGGTELWQRVSAHGLQAEGFTLHLNDIPLALPPPEGEPVVLVDRVKIVESLRDHLMALRCAPGTDIQIQHSTKVSSADLVHRKITVRREEDGHEEVLPYDVLVGSDGVRSRVREAMNSQLPQGQFESELKVMPGRWQVLQLELPPSFQAKSVHAMVSSSAPFGLFCIPSNSGQHCVIVSWSAEEAPEELLQAQTPEDLEAVLRRYFPKLGHIPNESAESFLKTQPSKAVVSRCRPLHNADYSIALLGDAAHAVGGGSLGQGCSAALQDAAALAACFKDGFLLRSALASEGGGQEETDWAQHGELELDEALASSLAAYSAERAAEGWALLDLIELQSAAEVRASALVQGPLVFGFFLEQLGRGTLKPLADIGGRLLEGRLQSNRDTSGQEVSQFVDHLQLKPTMNFSPAVLAFLLERAFLLAWKGVLEFLSRLKPAMQTALMSTDESYSQIVSRNETWLGLLRSAKVAAGVTRVSSVHDLHVLKDLSESESATWARQFTRQECLKDDVVLRQASTVGNFYGILSGSCAVFRGSAQVAQLGPGDSFGEVALLLGVPSPVSVTASADVTLLVMPGKAFLELAGRVARPGFAEVLAGPSARYGAGLAEVAAEQEQSRSRFKELLKDLGRSRSADAAAKAHLPESGDLDELLGTAGCEVYFEGDLVALGCQRMRVLEQGRCNVVRGGQVVRTLHSGDFFGPDLSADERVVATSHEVCVCLFSQEASASLDFLLK